MDQGIRVVIAQSKAQLAECHSLRYGSYCLDHPHEPLNEKQLEVHPWDEMGLTVSAIAYIRDKPLATMQFVKPDEKGEHLFPLSEPVGKAGKCLVIPDGMNPVEFARYACPRKVRQEHKLDLPLSACLRLALLHVLVGRAESEGFDYGIMLVEKPLLVLLKDVGLVAQVLVPDVKHRGTRYVCGISLAEFRKDADSVL